jgi:16S rRNA (cytidine1402-2'-O)-methyltransferase
LGNIQKRLAKFAGLFIYLKMFNDSSMGKLYMVATPIGNLGDFSARAIEVLKTVDFILAEDTRVAKKLLDKFGISGKPIFRCDESANPKVYQDAIKRLKTGESIIFMSDAGTPGVADPGWRLVSLIQKEALDIEIIPIPGPSSVAAALSVSGVPGDQYVFLGYPPHKKGRNKFFTELVELKIRPVVIFESPHRLLKTLEALPKEAEIVVCRELTKLYEEIRVGTASEHLTYFKKTAPRGEFVLVIK